jgi:hypothetical protein
MLSISAIYFGIEPGNSSIEQDFSSNPISPRLSLGCFYLEGGLSFKGIL